MESIVLKAYAKINLSLDVTGRRPNGYHDVKMIMQSVGLFDTLTFTKSREGINLKVDNSELSDSTDNLIYKAAKLLFDKFNLPGGIDISLEKNIPIAAGMAGGSTDAAATFKAVNTLYDLKLSGKELCDLAVKLGADIPFCIMGGTALSEGIGEKLTPIKNPPECILLVAKPDINVSTKEVYTKLDATDLPDHPDVDAMIKAIEEGDLNKMCSLTGNVLEYVTENDHPIISKLKQIMTGEGALTSMMSGSGPSVFGIFNDKSKAESAFNKIKETCGLKQVYITGFIF
ncbi:MAG: 4-(cytidine 5'-diphospho)-2-C-methyl-D-erythritol kinase [Lachnospiraceae bacterium]|nr:4-(cytidine 5'-diphospho)-2-C-methyl-D-erythritol kinase [Lachnospiraceae bacterium]